MRRLQPLPVVIGRVPPVDRRVVPAERDLQLVALVESQDHALDFGVEARARAAIPSPASERAEKLISPKNVTRGESADVMCSANWPWLKPRGPSTCFDHREIHVAEAGDLRLGYSGCSVAWPAADRAPWPAGAGGACAGGGAPTALRRRLRGRARTRHPERRDASLASIGGDCRPIAAATARIE